MKELNINNLDFNCLKQQAKKQIDIMNNQKLQEKKNEIKSNSDYQEYLYKKYIKKYKDYL